MYLSTNIQIFAVSGCFGDDCVANEVAESICMATYLLTWNPKKWNWETLDDDLDTFRTE